MKHGEYIGNILGMYLGDRQSYYTDLLVIVFGDMLSSYKCAIVNEIQMGIG